MTAAQFRAVCAVGAVRDSRPNTCHAASTPADVLYFLGNEVVIPHSRAILARASVVQFVNKDKR